MFALLCPGLEGVRVLLNMRAHGTCKLYVTRLRAQWQRSSNLDDHRAVVCRRVTSHQIQIHDLFVSIKKYCGKRMIVHDYKIYIFAIT